MAMELIGLKRKHEDDTFLDLSITKTARRSKPSRKLRKLNHEFEISPPKVETKRSTWFLLTITTGAGVVLMLLLGLLKFDEIKKDFLEHYEQQYNAFMDQPSRAKHSINAQEVMPALTRHVVGQTDALHEIEATLMSDGNYSGMALMGSSGVGKSLAAQLIFENSQSASKLYLVMDGHLRNNETWRVVNQLKAYGEKLLIIDDIAPSDWPAIRHLALKLQRSALRTFVVFIFQVSRFTTIHRSNYAANIEMLRRHLPPSIRPIEFRMLDQTDLELVIDQTSESLAGVRLTDIQKQHVIESVDLERHGAKNVRAKVSLVVY